MGRWDVELGTVGRGTWGWDGGTWRTWDGWTVELETVRRETRDGGTCNSGRSHLNIKDWKGTRVREPGREAEPRDVLGGISGETYSDRR